jgi:hypothetical protein
METDCNGWASSRGLGEAARKIFEYEVSATDLRDVARRYARRRATASHADDVVNSVLTDTLSAVISWDPQRVTLRKHVLDAIKSRLRHDRLRRKRFVHESLSSPSVCHEVERRLGGPAGQPESSQVVGWLRMQSSRDACMLKILDLFEEGVFEERRLLERLGVDKLAYRAARKRLRRLVEWMPNALKTNASATSAS